MKRMPFLLSFVFSFLLDQGTKALIQVKLRVGESIEVLGDYFRLTLVLNPGGLFGLGKGWGLAFILGFLAFSLGVLILLRKHNSLKECMPLGLLMGGAMGNTVDRFRFGAVLDFLDVGWGRWRWPVFNLADIAITVGVGLLLLSWIKGKRDVSGFIVL